ncbi:MAG: hypothetical protein IKA30_03900 [Alphaproteobacteria bacterium]|nr:hypothetical protein [Alphaproteobacteria bacterium]
MVNSSITLTASMRSNLMSLKTIATQMDRTQNILSTGKKVNSAIDNASSYYQARSLTNRAGDLNSLLDAMGQGIQTIQAATQGLESATAYLEQMKSVAEQALTMEAKPMNSKVELVDNSQELLAQGYTTVYNTDDLINAMRTNAKIVLMNDIELDKNYSGSFSNAVINGGGHTLSMKNTGINCYGGSGNIFENINIDMKNGYFHSAGRFSYRNVNVDYEGVGRTLLCCDSFVENVNIDIKSDDYVTAVYCNSGNLDVENLTISFASAKGSVTGIYAYGDVSVNGMSITSNARDVKGIWANGNISGVENSGNYANEIPSSLTDGKANTQAIVNQLKKDGKAAYATTQFYVGDKYEYFGQGKWYLPSIGELMDLYGTDYEAMTDGWYASDGDGYNLDAINTTLAGLGDIAEEMDGWYWSSSEYDSNSSWKLYTSGGTRDYYSKTTNKYLARAFRLVENCFNPSLLSSAEDDGIPKVGDIMYLDKSWGKLEDYDTSKADQVAGVICGVGDDGSVKVVSLKDLTFSSNDDAGVFNPEDPYGGSTKYVRWV